MRSIVNRVPTKFFPAGQLLVTALVCCLSVFARPVQGQDPTAASAPDSTRFRISALVNSVNGLKVGIVDGQTGRSYYLPVGQEEDGIEVVSADYVAEEVTLKFEQRAIVFHLAGDPNAREVFVAVPPPDQPEASTEEEDAETADVDDEYPYVEPELPEVEGLGEGIETFLREHPEVAHDLEKPQGKYGSGIETAMKLYPDMTKQLQQEPESETGLGSGIEEMLRQHPEFNTEPPPDDQPDPAVPPAN